MRYKLITYHGEGRTVFYVVDTESPLGDWNPAVLASTTDRSLAEAVVEEMNTHA